MHTTKVRSLPTGNISGALSGTLFSETKEALSFSKYLINILCIIHVKSLYLQKQKVITMQRSLIIGLIAALILTIFALRNDQVVSLYFLWGDPVKGSLSLILLVTIIIGVVLGIVFSIPSINKQSRIIHSKNKEIDKLNSLVEDYKRENKNREKKEES
jgi:uncharacterized integral membrane protein